LLIAKEQFVAHCKRAIERFFAHCKRAIEQFVTHLLIAKERSLTESLFRSFALSKRVKEQKLAKNERFPKSLIFCSKKRAIAHFQNEPLPNPG